MRPYLSWPAILFCSFTVVRSDGPNGANSGDMLKISPQLSIPRPQIASYDFNGSIDQVQFYGCSNNRVKRLKQSLTSTSQWAASARNLLDNPNSDSASFGVVDLIFGKAFTQYPNKTDNVNFVRNIFDSVSQGVTILGTDPITKSSNRIVCLTPENYKRTAPTARTNTDIATLFLGDQFWKDTRKSAEKPCDVFFKRVQGVDFTRPFVLLHEFAHSAGIHPTGPETYQPNQIMALNGYQAMQNAQTYSFAAAFVAFGCAKHLPGAQTNAGRPGHGELRKLLNSSDDPSNSTEADLEGVALPTFDETTNVTVSS